MINIVKKTLLILVLFVLIIGVFASTVQASSVDWQIIVRDDQTMEERVIIPQPEIDFLQHNQIPYMMSENRLIIDGWETVPDEKGKLVLYREHQPTGDFPGTVPAVPLQVEIKDYWLWKNISIKKGPAYSADKLLHVYSNYQDAAFTITVPGIIYKSSGAKVNEYTAAWKLDEIKAFPPYYIFLRYISINGFLLGVVIFALGFIIIGIVFIRVNRRTNRWIEEEYSLEKAREMLEKQQECQEKKE